jgi:hypothetical protein
LNEPVWSFEIRDQIDLTKSCWKTAYDQVQRLQAQGAPQDLVAVMSEIVNCYAEAHQALESVKERFPREPE